MVSRLNFEADFMNQIGDEDMIDEVFISDQISE